MTGEEQAAFDSLHTAFGAFTDGVWGVVRLVTMRADADDLIAVEPALGALGRDLPASPARRG